MPADALRHDILRDKLLEELRTQLAAAPDRRAMSNNFRVRSQDYTTLALMDEVPAHAEQAYAAWRDMLAEDEVLPQRLLLEMLAEVYAAAAADTDAAQTQSGQ